MTFPATTLAALPLIMIWAVLWISVVKARGPLNCSIGDGGNAGLLLRIRRHGNFIEWVPFTLILMMLAEANGTGTPWLYAAGALLLIGRIAHPFGLKIDNVAHPLRYLGNGPNFLAVAILLVALVRATTGL